MVFHYDSSDPLAIVTAPPPNETPDEKAAREEREAEAQRISDQIDDELRAEKVALKKQEQIVKILLLGQSESGKSTLDIQLGAYPAPGRLPYPAPESQLTVLLFIRFNREIYHPQESVTRLDPRLARVLITRARFSNEIRTGQVGARARLLENRPTA